MHLFAMKVGTPIIQIKYAKTLDMLDPKTITPSKWTQQMHPLSKLMAPP